MFKEFLYLDEQKMYSLSSQLFEGITEYILNENESREEEKTKQNGPLGSGRIMADVINSAIKSTEKRFLHDHSFILLENELLKKDCVFTINESDKVNTNDFQNYSFIKIKAKAIFNDINKIKELFLNFNLLGESITRLSIEEYIEKELLTLHSDISEKEYKKVLNEFSRLRKREHIIKLAEKNKLRRDEQFMKDLSFMTEFGFSNDFEIKQNINDFLFTSTLNRKYLREEENSLIKKYSRQTEKEIIILGAVTQCSENNTPEPPSQINARNMKEGLSNLIEYISAIEHSLFGKAENEVIIDPIAVYIEL